LSIAAASSLDETRFGSKLIRAFRSRRSTSTATTPGIAETSFFTRATHATHDMPSTGITISAVRAASSVPVRGFCSAAPMLASEVAGIGGFVRQYHVEVSSARMRALTRTARPGSQLPRQIAARIRRVFLQP